ncbi:MAG: putative endonuclease [Mycobacterium sp.]|jgi:putative endonuclease|nr:putative endonuclease [Mycobacterium sp.]MDT5206680.1 putative endonuclease [Mycobacterium sp.]
MLMTVECQFNAARAFIGDYYVTGDNRPLFGGDRSPADIRVGILQQGGGMTMLTRAELGALGERLAADHLTGLGLQIVARNWRCRYGELDLIAVDPVADAVVFAEVKTRTGDGFGGLAEAVTVQKARRLRRLAGIWLATQDQRWAALRIDVIGVRIGRRRTPELTHLQGVG